MSPDDKRHGTHAGYQAHKRDHDTPCLPCTRAFTRWRKNYEVRALNAGGRVKVPAAPVQAHLATLMQTMTVQAIATMSGVSTHAITEALEGKWQTVRRSTADPLLAIKQGDLPAGNHWISAVGSTRRLQALQAIGWSLQTISTKLGTGRHNSRVRLIGSGAADRVTVNMHERIKAVYAQLWDQSPAIRSPHDKACITATIRRAERMGWVPPLAWDDIDDPNATPDVGEETHRATGGKGVPVEVLVENIEWLLQFDPTLTASQLAARLGYADRSGIQNALGRHGYRDLLDTLNRNQEMAA